MVTFSDEIRSRLAEVATDLDEWERFLRDYGEHFRSRFVPEPDPTDPALSTRDKVRLLALSALAYTRQLAWAIVHAVNAESTASLYLATRAHFEMTGFLAYLLWQLRQLDAATIREEQLLETLNRLHLGRLHGHETLAPQVAKGTKAIRVMKFIDAVERVFEGPELKGLFRDGYAWLSEFCHPNSFSRFATQELVGRTVLFATTPRIQPTHVSVAIGHVTISHIIFFHCYKAIVEWLGGMPPEDTNEEELEGGA